MDWPRVRAMEMETKGRVKVPCEDKHKGFANGLYMEIKERKESRLELGQSGK